MVDDKIIKSELLKSDTIKTEGNTGLFIKQIMICSRIIKTAKLKGDIKTHKQTDGRTEGQTEKQRDLTVGNLVV